jgi:putative photosynthetic complex assembly protein
MSDHHHDQKIPSGVLIGAAVLICVTFALAGSSRRALQAENSRPLPQPIESLELRFEDRPTGALAVIEDGTNREVALLPPNSNGFIRGVLRGMFRDRKLESLGRDAHFALVRQADGRLTLEDHQTHRRVDLNSFGSGNGAAFEALLDAGRRAQR